MKLEIYCPNDLIEAAQLEFSIINIPEQYRLSRCIARLTEVYVDCDVLAIEKDRYPFSFTFGVFDDTGKMVIHGGIIFHGDNNGWSVHT